MSAALYFLSLSILAILEPKKACGTIANSKQMPSLHGPGSYEQIMTVADID